MEAWHSRGYLPHFEAGEAAQFVTFRLADSLPRAVLRRWREETRCLPRAEADALVARRVDGYLDCGNRNAFLADPDIAPVVEAVLLRLDGVEYRVHAWVVMPNHVHVLATLLEGYTLGEVIHGWKGVTAHAINARRDRTGHVWQREYYDRFIRNQAHFARTVEYIHRDPVKAGLCRLASDWQYSSARCRSSAQLGVPPPRRLRSRWADRIALGRNCQEHVPPS